MVNQSLTCAQIQATLGYLQQSLSNRLPNGSGFVLIDVRFTHDGVSVRPNCDGPLTRVRTQNTSTQTAWALLPNKRRGNKWQQIDPGTDVTITQQSILTAAGLDSFSDVAKVEFVYSQPAG